MSSILPKGIVVNSPRAEDSIEDIGAKPLDLAEIAEYWKVYTTTKRRLLDPTAERLENYWWRIWGSQRRELEAATIARIFRHISHGPTVVPLRGPDNRDEGAPLENQARYIPAATSSETTLQHSTEDRPRTTASSSSSRTPTTMPPPILKKTRGPSTTGPRPTARFVSPHESEKEMSSSSSVGSNSQTSAEPPAPKRDEGKSDGKPSTSGRKKPGLVASTAGKKKRPVLSRRQSSQTSQSSSDSKTANSTASAQSSLQRTPPSSSEQKQGRVKNSTHSKAQEESPAEYRSAGKAVASKAQSGSNSVTPKRYISPKLSGQEVQITKSVGATSNTAKPSTSHSLHPAISVDESNENCRLELGQGGSHCQQANLPTEKPPRQRISQSKETDRGQILHKTLSSRSSGKHESTEAGPEVKGAPSLAHTLTAATAQLALDDPISLRSSHSTAQTSPRAEKSKNRDPHERQQTHMFSKRPVPPAVRPVVSEPAAPLSKSKSQLTLLLEKDRAKSGEHAPANSKR